ncbi:hypothetical protein [Rhizobium leguminosarum]|uniref:hypothetical protein n=1 Tax=Rhizobium leguminosarum TaxID=384 RepID=UPI001441D235|nr:hypothetical protein [Rhizobium leguminosarum]MBY5819038.1 hypothetical protein [Rhizobium leguminosarum]NKL80164.1 hypothetical protein [Rhizobium leguminosarum bv. viciae]
MKILEYTSRPSNVRALATALREGKDVAPFVAAVEEFLHQIRPDGGAVDDLIVSTANELSASEIWASVPLARLYPAFIDAPKKTTDLFMKGMPSSIRVDLQKAISRSRPSTSVIYSNTAIVKDTWLFTHIGMDHSEFYSKLSDIGLSPSKAASSEGEKSLHVAMKPARGTSVAKEIADLYRKAHLDEHGVLSQTHGVIAPRAIGHEISLQFGAVGPRDEPRVSHGKTSGSVRPFAQTRPKSV